MKPSPNHLNDASVAGLRRRSPESARSAGPRRWVGPQGGCALRGVRTSVNCLRHPARGGVGMTASICARAHATVRWYRLTGVRLVRHTSVDHRGRLLSRVSRGNMGASSQFKGDYIGECKQDFKEDYRFTSIRTWNFGKEILAQPSPASGGGFLIRI
jgi:hypothetical protein